MGWQRVAASRHLSDPPSGRDTSYDQAMSEGADEGEGKCEDSSHAVIEGDDEGAC